MKHLSLALLPLAVLFSSGCHGNGGLGPALFATGVVTGAVLASEREPSRYERPDDRGGAIYQTIYVVQRPETAPAQRAAAYEPAPPPPPFDAVNARNALVGVDLTKCRETGAPRGYGHAKVTFNPSGDISKVIVDEPTGMPAAAAKCIGDAIGRTTVPVFNGSLVTVGTTWFVP